MNTPAPPDLPGVPSVGFTDLLRMVGYATADMLDTERRRPEPGTKPVGRYWTGHQWALLWRHDQTVPKTPLSPKRQRQWDFNRTCARCSKRSERPMAKAGNGQRICGLRCEKLLMKQWWEQQRAAERPELTAWARDVRDDDRVVLVAGAGQWRWAVPMRVETLGGEVLADVHIARPRPDPVLVRGMPAEVEQRSVDAAAAAALLTAVLAGRRLLTWHPWHSLHEVAEIGRLAAVEPGGPGIDDTDFLRGDLQDLVGPRYETWIGEPSGPVQYARRCRRISAGTEPREVIGRARQAIAEMAEGLAPDGR